MPIKKSAKKALRASQKKRVFNDRRKNTMKLAIKDFRTLVKAGKKDEAMAKISTLQQAIDKATKRGIIKPKNADRKKSRLTKSLVK